MTYHGPEQTHAAQLALALPMKLQEFDYFAQGYSYSRTTVFADLQRIPLQDHVLDGAIVLHVLEHVPSLDTALAELARVLRPGTGFLQHETPCYWPAGTPKGAHLSEGARRAMARDGSENCSTSREAHDVGYLCAQHDHLWGHSCAYLQARLRAHRFSCHLTPRLTHANATRFIGPGVTSMKPATRWPPRLCCKLQPVKKGSHSQESGVATAPSGA